MKITCIKPKDFEVRQHQIMMPSSGIEPVYQRYYYTRTKKDKKSLRMYFTLLKK